MIELRTFCTFGIPIYNVPCDIVEISNYVEYLFNLYKPYMWWILLAAAGVWSIVMGVFIGIANKNDEKQKAKKMLVNYVVGLIVIATILVGAPYLVKGIAALVAG